MNSAVGAVQNLKSALEEADCYMYKLHSTTDCQLLFKRADKSMLSGKGSKSCGRLQHGSMVSVQHATGRASLLQGSVQFVSLRQVLWLGIVSRHVLIRQEDPLIQFACLLRQEFVCRSIILMAGAGC